jgi:hypothetical protein
MVIRDPVLLSEGARLDAPDGRFVALPDHGASCVDLFCPYGGFPDDADDRPAALVDQVRDSGGRDSGVGDLDEVVRH